MILLLLLPYRTYSTSQAPTLAATMSAKHKSVGLNITRKTPSTIHVDATWNRIGDENDKYKQALVGDETSYAARDSAPISILRPFDRGYITNWEPEFEVRDNATCCVVLYCKLFTFAVARKKGKHWVWSPRYCNVLSHTFFCWPKE